MSINIRYPNITALNEREQIAQIRSYLHQLVEQLNYALPNLGSVDGSKSSKTYEVQGGDMTYYELRTLVVQELQRVETQFDELVKNLDANMKKAVDDALKDKTDSIAIDAAGRISFSLDEDGNLYYEVITDDNTNNEVEE